MEKKEPWTDYRQNLSVDELLKSFVTNTNSNARDFNLDEVLRRSEKNVEVIKPFVNLFFSKEATPSMRLGLVNMVRQIDGEFMIETYGQMLKVMLDEEPEGAANGLESARMWLYKALGKYPKNPTLPTILIHALENEQFSNEVLDELVKSLVKIGPSMVPKLENLLKNAKDVFNGRGRCVIGGAVAALLQLGVSQSVIDEIMRSKTEPKKQSKRFGLF